MKKTNKEIIRVRLVWGTNKELAKKHRVSIQSVSNAVNGHTNSDKAKKIRIDAVNMGGDAIYN